MRIVAWWLRVSRGGAGLDYADEVALDFTVTPTMEVGGPYGFGHRAHHPDPEAHYVFSAVELHSARLDEVVSDRPKESR